MQVEKPVGLWGAYVMGLAFAFGWTPCIGPILAAILAVAGSEDTVQRGATLLAAYSPGLGIPFMLAARGAGDRSPASCGGSAPAWAWWRRRWACCWSSPAWRS